VATGNDFRGSSDVLPEVYGGGVDTCHCFVCDGFKFV